MQKLLQFASLLAIALVATLQSSADAQWPQYSQVGEENYIEFGLRALQRPGDNVGFGVLQNATTLATLLSAEDASSPGSAAGAELSYNFKTRHGRRFEFRTFTADFDSSRSFDGGNLQTPFLPDQIIDTLDYDYDSRIFSFELNVKRAIFNGATLFGGPRFVHLDDDVSATIGQDASADGATVSTDTTTQRTAEAINNLIGLQTGLKFQKRATRHIRGQGLIRFGGYLNPTRVRIADSRTFDPGTGLQTFSNVSETSKSTGSLLVEVGGKLFVDIRPNISCFAGYEATFIDGIALGPPTLLTTASTGEVETNNTLFIGAVTAGFQVNW